MPISFSNSTGYETARIGAKFQDAGDRNTDLYFCTRANGGSLSKRLTINSLGTATFSSSTGSSGIVQNAMTSLAYSGYVAGNATLSFSLTNVSQASLRMTAVMNHYGYIGSYGCSLVATFANGPGLLQSQEIQRVDTSNGGAWSITQTSATGFTISKSAGSYSGGGYYFVEVVGANAQYA